MRLASAQIKGTVGDLKGNLKTHLRCIEIAAKQHVDLIIFPEMSLTGYTREQGKVLALTTDSDCLVPLQKVSNNTNMIIVVGGPLRLDDNIYIGSFIIKPNAEIETYTKQFLHEGEELFYECSFDYNPILMLNRSKIMFAICADIDNAQHAKNASDNNCAIYLPSIFFSEKGIEKGHEVLKNYSETHQLNILMSNYCGEHWNIMSGGRSAFWTVTGEKLNELDHLKEGLLLVKQDHERWITSIIEI